MAKKKELAIKLDLESIKTKLEKYIYKKIQKTIREDLDEDIMTMIDFDFPTLEVHYPDLEKRLAKLEDWKLDIEQGWIKIDSGTKKKV